MLVGVACAKLGWIADTWWLLALLASPFLISRRWSLPALIILAFVCGLWRGSAVFANLSQFERLYGQTVTLQGVIEDDPAIAERFQTEFHLHQLQLLGGEAPRPLPGRLRIRAFIFTKLQRGYVLEVRGQLRPSLGNRQGQIDFGQAKVLKRYSSPVERLRQRFLAGVYTAIPEPAASLGLGFLVGTRSLLPDETEDQLAATGLTHIVA
ncbi:MAG: DUF4131 domain-containing protein, partial [Acidobacteriota bacterium]